MRSENRHYNIEQDSRGDEQVEASNRGTNKKVPTGSTLVPDGTYKGYPTRNDAARRNAVLVAKTHKT